jgi:hypothetical protein
MKAAIKNVAAKASGVATLALVTAGHAMAQTTGGDQGIQAINDLGTKATGYIGAAFTVAVLVAAGFWGIRMMKKSFGAAK